MPLLVLPGDEALNRTRNANSRWPRTPEAQAQRLMPMAQPGFSPSFRINKQELVFTVGSCFARNIEKQLTVEGYNIAAGRFAPPEELGFKADPDALLNRYVVFSILNELRWALDPAQPFPEAAYLELKPGQWFDPHLHPSIQLSPLEEVRKRRRAITSYMALAGQARVFVMTLGLAEAWYDTQTGLYLNGVLPVRRREPIPERYQFHLLDYEQILHALEDIRALLVTLGHPEVRMLVTVSPVAMNTTFTGGEVLTANTYSKAVQRAAVEAFVRRHDNVDYFPSYESVVLSDRKRAWRDDQAHASDAIVRLNVLRMIEAYAGNDAETAEPASEAAAAAAKAFALVQKGKEALAAGDIPKARKAFGAAAKCAPEEGLVLLEFGRFLFDQKEFTEAVHWIKLSVRRGSGAYGGYYAFAQALRGAGRYEEAYKAARRARNQQPNRPGVVHLSADIACRLGRFEEALALADACVALEPASESFLRFREKVRRRAGRHARVALVKTLLGVPDQKPARPPQARAS